MNIKRIIDILKQAVQDFGKHNAPRLAAALSYYTIFSMAPLLVIGIAMAGLIYGQKAAQDQIVGQISGVVGADAASLIQTMIQNVNKPGAGIFATVIGLIALLAGAAGVFGQLKASLNTIWDIEPKPGSGGIKGILQGVRAELLSFLMVLGVGLLLLVSLILSAVLSSLSSSIGSNVPIPAGFWELVNFAATFLIMVVLFAALFKVLPDANMKWRDMWFGAFVTALLFTIGKWLIGLYLGHTSTASVYGAAGGLVVLLLWIYYSAQILFLGAEITQAYAHMQGSMFKAGRASTLSAAGAAKQDKPVRSPAYDTAAVREPAYPAARFTAGSARSTAPTKRRTSVDNIENALRIITPILVLTVRIIVIVDKSRVTKKRA